MRKITRFRWTILLIALMCSMVSLSGVAPSPAIAQAPASAEDDDPDLPPFARGKIDKEEYLRLRDEHVSKLRGLPYDKPDARVRAIREMERQELANAPTIATTSWTPIGPAPIPNGGTNPPTPVSGRVSAIAVHPTNPNIVYVGAADGGVYRSTDGGTTWLAIFDSAQSLAIGAIAIARSDPTTVFVGTGESTLAILSFFGVGVYRIRNADTTPVLEGPFNLDGGGIDVMTGRAISKIVVDPTDNTIFVGTTSGIGGMGADQPAAPPSRGLFRSTNALAVTPTFTKLSVATAGSGNRAITDLVMDPGNPNVLVCAVVGFDGAGDGGIYRSANALASNPTFTRTLTIGTPSAGFRTELAINHPGTVTTVFAAIGEPTASTTCINAGQSGTLKKSTDGGQTWSAALPAADGFCGQQCFYNIALALDPENANIVILGGQNDSTCSKIVARSTNGGTSFTSVSSGVHTDTHAAVFAPQMCCIGSSFIAYMGTDGGISKSTDGGASWTSLNNAGFNATQFMSVALHPTDREFMIGGTQDNGTEFKRPDGTWTRADFGDGGFALIDRNAADTTNVTMYHTDFNRTGTFIGFRRVNTSACATIGQWAFRGAVPAPPDPTPLCDGSPALVLNGIGLGDSVRFYAPMALGPGSPNTVYFGTDRLYRSINKGDSMTVVSQAPIEAGQTVTAIGVSPQNDNVRIVGLSNGHVYATGHGASVLTNVGQGYIPEKYVGRAVIDPNNITTAYVTLAGFGLNAGQHIWKTTQLGSVVPTWNAAGDGIPDVPVNAFVVNPANSNHLYAGTDIGVYRSTDSGASWTPFSNGLPRVAVFDMAIQPTFNVLRIATHGRGIWEISIPAGGTDTIGLFNPADNFFYLRNSNTTGFADVSAPYGLPGDLPVVGDWDGNGTTTFGVYRPGNSTFYLRNSNTTGDPDITVSFSEGLNGDIPIVGDWDGNGTTTIGVYRPSQATFYLRNSNTTGNADISVSFGGANWKPIAGDWDGNGTTTIGVYEPSSATFYLRNSNTWGFADIVVSYGGANWMPVVGDWDGNGTTTLGVYEPATSTFFLRNSNTYGNADLSIPFGAAGNKPLAGDWDGL